MPRKPIPAASAPAILLNDEAAAQASRAATELEFIQIGYSAERDLVNQVLGQIQMADASAKFFQTVRTSKLAEIKDKKLYRALKGQKTADGQQFLQGLPGRTEVKSADGQQFLEGTWDEFCGLLGRSRQQVDEDISNFKLLGEEALEALTRMGIGYRQLREFRSLPDDDRSALGELAKTGDKTAVLLYAEDLLARNAALTAKAQEDEEVKAAKDGVILSQNGKINELSEQLKRPFKPKKNDPAKSAEDEAALAELIEATNGADVMFARLGVVIAELQDHTSPAIRERALQSAQYLVSRMREVVVTNALEVRVDDETLGGRPGWLGSVE